jgi:hypothetical protein
MVQRILFGILAGTLIGLFTTSFFLPEGIHLFALFWTKITAASIVTGLFCGIYAHFSKSEFQIFLISIVIGIIVFYLKYLITGHNFDPLTMGAFTGALLGVLFALIRKLSTSLKRMSILKRYRGESS